MQTNTHQKTISEIKMIEQKNNSPPTQFLSARTIRPSLFLNEADFHLPLISPQKRQVTEYQIIKQTMPKSQLVSPVLRRTQNQQDSEDQYLFVQNIVRKLKKQKLFIKDNHRSQQFLPQIEDHTERIIPYSTPKNKISTLNSITIDSQVLHSPNTKQSSTLIVNKEYPIQMIDYRIPKEIDQRQPIHHSSLPEQTNLSNNMQNLPHHKKTVSFRQSIFVIDINNGQVTKDQLSENSKPLQHILKPEIKEEQNDEDKRITFHRTRNFHLSDKLV